MNPTCQVDNSVRVGIPGVDGLPGDDHYELVACGQPATTEIAYRDEDDDWPCITREFLCDEHADSLRWAADQGFLTILSDDRLSAF